MPTVKQLEALRWIAVLGSYEKAAERLNATQSAVTKRIQELEASLGTAVFDRNRRGARLTVKGEAVFALAEELLSLRDQIVAVGSSQAAPIRQLRFGVTELTALTWLPAFVAEIRAAYPNIVLEPEVEQSSDLFQRLRNGTVDFIVVPDSLWQPGFKSVPLASVQNAWMCSPALLHDRGIVPLSELGRFNILTQGNRSGSGLVFGKWLEECGVKFPRLLTSNSLIAMVGLTIAEIGISYLPLRCFGGLIEQGKLRVIETDPPLPPVTYVAMFRGDEAANVINVISNISRATCDFTRPIRWA
ncbi:LysR family transcriptional regulator [Methylobacterium nodulans]|uniref:Transcriptional regulator, LysR family n=1 Tax=Methylobacterium nodulans (strain LMG 21967 / CNCM I-2342 / ORS 2060) TaxID=460265 RepID=B8IGL0_METNO|nr:LysR family transcriptional regulator [Methylobacterium nodulans]ACL55910.1 transcriptional regulator, LysR family [Methylobacterium nodulans ORS 2060]